jgi:hypothetical protein
MVHSMDEHGEAIYRYLKVNLTAESLKELSLKLIEAYKAKNVLKLKLFAESIFQDTPSDDVGGSRLFLRLIKYFHPDRLNYFLKDIDESYACMNFEKLRFYRNLLSADLRADQAYAERFDIDPQEIYRYAEDDFGYGMSDTVTEDLGEDLYETAERFDIFDAVKSTYLGNLDVHLAPEDLFFLEGELDLSDFNLYDLEGLQYCRNITSLNLSHNNLSNLSHLQDLHFLEELFISHNSIMSVEWLKGLSNLKIIDLSNNEVEDIRPLLLLERLEFINIQHNPISDRRAVQELSERCVIIF